MQANVVHEMFEHLKQDTQNRLNRISLWKFDQISLFVECQLYFVYLAISKASVIDNKIKTMKWKSCV